MEIYIERAGEKFAELLAIGLVDIVEVTVAVDSQGVLEAIRIVDKNKEHFDIDM